MKQFFDTVRKYLFKSGMSQSQVDGIKTILGVTSDLPISWRAYLLATAYLETAHTMQPITEYGGVRYFDKYDTGRLAKILGNTPEKDGDGYKYRGRGYVQITGYSNYKKASKALNVDLINKPDLALNPGIAASIMVEGTTEGWFTGKKLSDYLPGDYKNARRIINGLDRANDVKYYAEVFEAALKTIPEPKKVNPLVKFFRGLFR